MIPTILILPNRDYLTMPETSPFPLLPLPPFASHPHSSPDNDTLLLSTFEEWVKEYLKQIENTVKDSPDEDESRLDCRNAIFHYIDNLKQVILDLNAYIANHLDTDSPQSKIAEPTSQAERLSNRRRKVTQGFLRAAPQEQAKTRREFRRSEEDLKRVTNERDEARCECRKSHAIISRLEEEHKIQTDLHLHQLQTLQSRIHQLQSSYNQLHQSLTDKTIEVDVLVEESQNWSHERANLMLENASLTAKVLATEDVNRGLERTLDRMMKGMERMNGLRREVLRILRKL